jgi:hypothetical protein
LVATKGLFTVHGKEESMARICLTVWLFLGLAWNQAVADPTLKDLAARTELHPIETLTVSVRQFLTGDKTGKPFTIAGHLRFPQGVTTIFWMLGTGPSFSH